MYCGVDSQPGLCHSCCRLCLYLHLGCSQNVSPLFIYFFKLEKANESYPCTVNTTLFLLFFERYLFCPFKKQLVLHFPVKKYTRKSELYFLPLKSLVFFVRTWMALCNLEFLYSKPVFCVLLPKRAWFGTQGMIF